MERRKFRKEQKKKGKGKRGKPKEREKFTQIMNRMQTKD